MKKKVISVILAAAMPLSAFGGLNCFASNDGSSVFAQFATLDLRGLKPHAEDAEVENSTHEQSTLKAEEHEEEVVDDQSTTCEVKGFEEDEEDTKDATGEDTQKEGRLSKVREALSNAKNSVVAKSKKVGKAIASNKGKVGLAIGGAALTAGVAYGIYKMNTGDGSDECNANGLRAKLFSAESAVITKANSAKAALTGARDTVVTKVKNAMNTDNSECNANGLRARLFDAESTITNKANVAKDTLVSARDAVVTKAKSAKDTLVGAPSAIANRMSTVKKNVLLERERAKARKAYEINKSLGGYYGVSDSCLNEAYVPASKSTKSASTARKLISKVFSGSKRACSTVATKVKGAPSAITDGVSTVKKNILLKREIAKERKLSKIAKSSFERIKGVGFDSGNRTMSDQLPNEAYVPASKSTKPESTARKLISKVFSGSKRACGAVTSRVEKVYTSIKDVQEDTNSIVFWPGYKPTTKIGKLAKFFVGPIITPIFNGIENK